MKDSIQNFQAQTERLFAEEIFIEEDGDVYKVTVNHLGEEACFTEAGVASATKALEALLVTPESEIEDGDDMFEVCGEIAWGAIKQFRYKAADWKVEGGRQVLQQPPAHGQKPCRNPCGRGNCLLGFQRHSGRSVESRQ